MDENTWRLSQVIMWIVGTQTVVLGGILAFIWNNLSKRVDHLENKMENKFDGLSHQISDVDKRLYAVETMLHLKDCCMLKDDRKLSKAE